MGVLHPHPVIGRLFTELREVPNFFNINLQKVRKPIFFFFFALADLAGSYARAVSSRVHNAVADARKCITAAGGVNLGTGQHTSPNVIDGISARGKQQRAGYCDANFVCMQ
jgi:hypothetical protein